MYTTFGLLQFYIYLHNIDKYYTIMYHLKRFSIHVYRQYKYKKKNQRNRKLHVLKY